MFISFFSNICEHLWFSSFGCGFICLDNHLATTQNTLATAYSTDMLRSAQNTFVTA